ncbi:hypothetical protein ABK040_005379 [Willaertia magna]
MLLKNISVLLNCEKYLKTNDLFSNNVYYELFLQFKELYTSFIVNSSTHCVNIAGSLREDFTKEYNLLINNETMSNANRFLEKTKKLYQSLKKELLIQLNTEIFPLLKQQESFKLFILSKIIEANTEPEIEINSFLKTNEMDEYCKLFKKRKLIYLSQLQEFSGDDLREVGITKLGHVKKLLRLIKQVKLSPEIKP